MKGRPDSASKQALHSSQPNTDIWSIEFLRGAAALLVVFAHYQVIAGLDIGVLRFAFTGVDLFFVISGFVFAPYFFKKNLDFFPHFIRRLFRLYPMYALALLIYVSLSVPASVPITTVVKHAFFLHTLESREIAFSLNTAFWSLPPEVEFYLFLPLLARCSGSIRSVSIITLLALISHLVFSWYSPPYPAVNPAFIANVHLPGMLVEFMFGVLGWWVSSHISSSAIRLALISFGLLLWYLIAQVFVELGDSGVEQINLLRGNIGLIAAFSLAFVVTGLVGFVKQPPRWVASFAICLGNLSYGVYLFHNAMPLVMLRYKELVPSPIFALLCLAATLIVAQFFYWAWEAPCRAKGRSIANAMSRNKD